VGKSTLLNLLLQEDKAIVSDVHGTTRDAIEDTMNIGGVLFRFIDTAGIRHTTDAIETMGIERTYRKIEQASIVLWVIDVTAPIEKSIALASSIVPKLIGKEVILLFNKSDLASEATLQAASQVILQAIEGALPEVALHHLFISAKTRRGIDQLLGCWCKPPQSP